MILIKNGNVYSPKFIGKKDILIAGLKIIAIEDSIEINSSDVSIETYDAKGKNIYPGFVDAHVHITGGGGEGSYKTRTPEIVLSDIVSAGVTTIVGCLGTDGITRTMTNLLAKAYGLSEEGISTYVYTGSYQIPVKTLTENILSDLVLIEKIIGVGEVALADHRSSAPSIAEVRRLAADARVGGMLSGKAGIVNVHMGDSDELLYIIEEIVEKSDIPITQFLPTHINRNKKLFEAGINYAKKGGYLDFTTSTTKQFLEDGEVSCAKALKRIIDENIDISQITMTSDGQGSLPQFDKNNQLIGLKIGKQESLYRAVVDAVNKYNVPLEDAISTITANPATILKLKNKGFIKLNYDADLVIADQNSFKIESVIAKGIYMVKNNEVVKKGTFE